MKLLSNIMAKCSKSGRFHEGRIQMKIMSMDEVDQWVNKRLDSLYQQMIREDAKERLDQGKITKQEYNQRIKAIKGEG